MLQLLLECFDRFEVSFNQNEVESLGHEIVGVAGSRSVAGSVDHSVRLLVVGPRLLLLLELFWVFVVIGA